MSHATQTMWELYMRLSAPVAQNTPHACLAIEMILRCYTVGEEYHHKKEPNMSFSGKSLASGQFRFLVDPYGFGRLSRSSEFLQTFIIIFFCVAVIYFADRGHRSMSAGMHQWISGSFLGFKRLAPPWQRPRASIELCSRRAASECGRKKTSTPLKI